MHIIVTTILAIKRAQWNLYEAHINYMSAYSNLRVMTHCKITQRNNILMETYRKCDPCTVGAKKVPNSHHCHTRET